MQTKNKPMWLSCLLSQAVWAAGLVTLLLISCAAANASEDPGSMIRPLALACLYLSAMISGFAAVRLSGDGILSGMLSGSVTALLMLLLSCLPLPGSGFLFPYTLLLTACVIPAGCAGALIGRKRQKRKSPAKKNYKRKR